jgi:hypothetical protein
MIEGIAKEVNRRLRDCAYIDFRGDVRFLSEKHAREAHAFVETCRSPRKRHVVVGERDDGVFFVLDKHDEQQFLADMAAYDEFKAEVTRRWEEK